MGGGIVGLSTSIALRVQGFSGSIALVERFKVGAGATGRSGGILYADEQYIPGSTNDLNALRDWLSRIDLDFLLASGSDRLSGCPLEYDACLVDPQRLVNELALCASKLGVDLYNGSPVRTWHEDGRSAILEVNGLPVRSSAVLFATGAYSAPLLLKSLDILLSEEDCAVVQLPFSSLPWTFCGLAPDDPTDFMWGRRVADDLLLVGGGRTYSSPAASSEAKVSRLLAGLSTHFPSWKTERVVAHWTGRLSRFSDGAGWRTLRLPGFNRILLTDGFDGQGLLAGFHAANEAAESLIALVAG